MGIALQSFATVAEAERALSASGAQYLGGGTLVLRALNEGDVAVEHLVRVTDAAITDIAIDGGRARIGAGVTMTAVARHTGLEAIASAARAVGGPAIRNMATVGGNLFAAAPYGDFAVALLALDATVETGGADRPIEAFLADRAAGKSSPIVTSVSFALPPPGSFRFRKVSRVKPKGVSVLSIAAVIETAEDGRVLAARIALGCMAPRPMRAKAAEAALAGQPMTEQGVAAAVAAVAEGIDPITDAIASAWYRAEVLPVHLRRLLLE
ncbi:MAG: FAD binding domain-containing protein [Rhizobiaceae bacterium]|nr:FAD binding domain-containing protein [Rhizobiaceae bacterium]